MYDATVLICVVLVIAFETSQFKTGTVNNVRNNIDVDISMINLHRCNGILHKNSTLCCYEKEKHFPNMAD